MNSAESSTILQLLGIGDNAFTLVGSHQPPVVSAVTRFFVTLPIPRCHLQLGGKWRIMLDHVNLGSLRLDPVKVVFNPGESSWESSFTSRGRSEGDDSNLVPGLS